MLKREFEIDIRSVIATGKAAFCSALVTVSQPSQFEVHSEVTNNPEVITRQYPECGLDRNTLWVLDFGDRYVTYDLGPLSEQCGNGEIIPPQIGGFTLDPNSFPTVHDRIFDNQSTRDQQGQALSCPAGFESYEFINTELNPQDQSINTRLILNLGNKSEQRSLFAGSFIQKCIDRFGNSIPVKEIRYSLSTILENLADSKTQLEKFIKGFTGAFGSVKGQPNYEPQYDYNNNEVVDILDYSQFINPTNASQLPQVAP